MSTPLQVLEGAAAADPVATVRRAYERLRTAHAADPNPTAAEREDRLDRLITIVQRRRDEIAEAIAADFGARSRRESFIADVFLTIDTARHARRHVARWMRDERVRPEWLFLPSRARVQHQPLGVVGVIAPWNYPVNLALAPLAAALAAGNRVLVKPSELTPRTSELVESMLREAFTTEEVAVVTGGPEVARAVTSLPLDHLIFTGSTRVGRDVARAAAENLVPVTLELGGKSPVLVHPEYPLAHAADRILCGKLFNAGQTCIAPDYVLLPKGLEERFAGALRSAAEKRFGRLAKSADYASIATRAGHERLRALLADAEAKGARIETLMPGGGAFDEGSRRLAPAIVWNAPEDARVMQEEIFGPILPVKSVASVDEAIAYVNARPRPLALYCFDTDASRAADVLRRTTSGGAVVNDTMLHFAQERLPFGGVGASGMGAYHGRTGFLTFSHRRSVFETSRLSVVTQVLSPPYGTLLDRALDVLIGGRVRRPGE